MKKLTIKEYAQQENISTQAVYGRIKKELIYATEINKKKYVLLEDGQPTSTAQNTITNKHSETLKKLSECKSTQETIQEENDSLKAQNSALKNELETLQKNSSKKVEVETKKTVVKKEKNYLFYYIAGAVIITTIANLTFCSISKNAASVVLKKGALIYNANDEKIYLPNDRKIEIKYKKDSNKIHFNDNCEDFYYIKD